MLKGFYFHPDPWENDPIWGSDFSKRVGSTSNYEVMVSVGGLGPGGWHSWDPLMKVIGILSGTRLEFQTTGPQTTNLPLVETSSVWSTYLLRQQNHHSSLELQEAVQA